MCYNKFADVVTWYNRSSTVITWYNIVILYVLLILPVGNVITENVVFSLIVNMLYYVRLLCYC